jgi:hypothetical protein
MDQYFEFYDVPTEIKTMVFQKNRDVALHRRRTRWMHHELSMIQFFRPITGEDKEDLYDDIFLRPSDLFERQDSEDLGEIFEDSWYHGGFPYYHDELIHENKWKLHEELGTTIREREHKLEDEFCDFQVFSSFIDE